MKNIYNCYILIVVLASIGFTACDEDPTEALEEIIKEDKGYLPVIATFTLISPDDAQVQPGEGTSFDLRYWSEGKISEIQFWLIQDDQETQIGEYDYTAAYSIVTRTDSLIFNYTVPATIPQGENFSVEARVVNDGLEEYPARKSVELTVVE